MAFTTSFIENIIFSTLLIWFTVFGSLSQTFAQSISHFNKADGLPSDLIKSVTFDDFGFVWLATDEGLVRFDGKNHKHFLDELPSPYVKFVFKRKNGHLLATTDLGLVEIVNPQQPRIKVLLEAKSAPSEQYLCYPKFMYEDAQNTLWISDNWHIVALREGKFKHYKFPKKDKTSHFQRSFSFFELGKAFFAFSNTGFLYRYEPTSDSFIEIAYPQKSSNIFHVITLSPNKALFSASEGVFELFFDEKSQVKGQKLIKSDLDISYFARVDTLIYASSWTKGLFTISPKYEINELKLPTNNLSSISPSPNNILLASDNGLFSLNKRTFLPQHQEVTRNYIQSFCQDQDQVYYTDGEKVITSSTDNTNKASVIYKTTFGTLLGIGKRRNEIILSDTKGYILSLVAGRAKKIHDLSAKGNAIFSCFVDSKQRTWFCQDGNSDLICLLPTNELKFYGKTKGIISNPLMVKESPEGVIYCGGTQDNGFLFALNEKNDYFENLSQKVDFQHNEPIITNDIAFQGKKILVGSSFGLLLYENGKFERKELGLITPDAIKALAVDKRQDIWLANSKGVLKLVNNEVLLFDELQGIPSKGIAYRSFLIDNSQKLWIGTFNGLGLMQDTARFYKTPNPVLLEASAEPNSEGVYEIYANGFLQLDYAVNILPQKQILYQININGTWEDMGSKTSLLLSKLSVGDHTLKIRAKQSGNYIWSDHYDLKILVKQVWYFTWWGALLILLALLVLIGFFVHLNTWYHKRNQKKLENIIEMRTNDLKGVNEELKQNFEELQIIQEQLSLSSAQNEAITSALDNSAIVSVTDLKGRIIKTNEIFSEISGYTAEELLGQDHRIVNSGHHPHEFWVEMWKAIAKGQTWRAEVCNRAKNGELYWVDTVINPVYDAKGKIYQYLSIRSVITDRKKAEQALQAQTQALLVSEEELKQNLEELNTAQEQLQENLSVLTKQHQTIVSSINYALRIQSAIIPKESELQKHLDCFIFFRPRDIVSGDFYWFAYKGNTKILAVADCTGHGVSGAFMTMIANNILNQIVHDHEIHEPDEILNLMPIFLEKILLHSEGMVKDGMDILIVTIENRASISLRNGVSKVSYAGAMNSLYYIENKEFKELRADKVPIGGKRNEDFQYQKHELIFNEINSTSDIKNLTFYLCSDGFQDQFGGEDDKKFMVRRFKNLLFEISPKPMLEQKQILEQTFDAWKGESKQTDDVLVLGIRV